MKIVDREGQGKYWDKYWKQVKKDFFKVEVLQYYEEDVSPSLVAWLKGDKEKALILLEKEAIEVEDWAKGKKKVKKVRVHVVDLPLTDYLQWEIEWYKRVNIPRVGEKVYIIDNKKIKHLDLPDGDFMIFDNGNVIKNTYDNKGWCTGAEIYEGSEVGKFVDFKKAIMEFAVPLESFKV